MQTQVNAKTPQEPVPFSAMSPMEKRLFKAKEEQDKADGKPVEKKSKAKVLNKKEKKELLKASKPKAEKLVKVSKSKESTDGKIELKTICGQLNLDPKAARRVLRNSDLDFHADRGRWAFTEKQAEKVKALLTKK